MTATKPTYDLVLMLDTAATDEQRKKILADVEAMVSRGGEIIGTQDWGVRTMAFEIRHKTDSEYHLLQFHGSPELLATMQRTLRITDGVVRFRIIKLAPGTPAPPEVRPEVRPEPAAAPVESAAPDESAVPAAPVEPAPAAEPAAAAAAPAEQA